MSQEKIYFLIEKYLNNTATEQEKETLLKWYRSESPDEVEWDSENPDEEKEIKAQMYKQIENQINRRKLNTRYWYRISAAAIILLAFSVTLYFYFSKPDQQLVTQKPQLRKTTIVPGGNKAVLTLSDGSTIVLDNAANGVLADQHNTSVNKLQDGKLVYALHANDETVKGPVTYNTIAIPRGGQYQIVLPDGTRVWLNSESSLRFPTSFTETYRNVELTGEAYFEVAKNTEKPFKVQLPDQTEVEVLGTHFNIMAYSDENSIYTTLLEGSVKVHKGPVSKTIVPGEQAVVSSDLSSINIKRVDIDGVVAWKNGYFMFKNENIQSIMKKISRWYNVDVVYRQGISKKVFAGTVSRFENVSEVLEMLELTGSIHFNIDGRRITVMP